MADITSSRPAPVRWINPTVRTPSPPCPPVAPAPCKCRLQPLLQPTLMPSAAPQSTADEDNKGFTIILTVCVGFASFLVGVALSGTILWVYIKTDPRHRMQPVAMSDDSCSSNDSAAPKEKLVGSCNAPSTSLSIDS